MNYNDLKNLPKTIKLEKRWVLYGKNHKTGSSKCPFIYDIRSNKIFALSTNKKYFSVNNFYDLEDTIKIYNAFKKGKISVWNGEIYGIGYYFYKSKYSVIDVDNVFYDDSNDIRRSFKKLVDDCYNKTYIGLSSSHRGFHIIVENDIELCKWEFKLKNLEKAYKKAGINIEDELKTEGKTPGIDFLCDMKFVALTGNQYNKTTSIDYKTSDYKKIYDLFKKYHISDSEKEKFKKSSVKRTYSKYNSGSQIINNKLYVSDYFGYIKSKLSLFDVVSYYSDGRLLDGNLHYCPLHQNQHNKSFIISAKDNNKYICFSSNCQNGGAGDIFDFTMKINNLSNTREVAERLNDNFNLGLIFNWQFQKAN